MYLDPAYHFTYPGFGWVQPWPGWGMHAHMAVLVGLGVAIALGWHTRVALGAYLLGFTYVELLDRTYYLNHYYWITVAGLVLLLLPGGRVWSLGRAARRVGATRWPPG
ncbi:MAG: HTTM domain-containing protein [Actinobacteria bacterium]|nr:HTTM domain-containing protein [Actinomycetota bacterium]